MENITCAMGNLFGNYLNWRGSLSRHGYWWAWCGILAVNATLSLLLKLSDILSYIPIGEYLLKMIG